MSDTVEFKCGRCGADIVCLETISTAFIEDTALVHVLEPHDCQDDDLEPSDCLNGQV